MYVETSLEKYMEEISQIAALSRSEETTLIPAAQAGDSDAFDQVIKANLRFVVTIAHEYKDRGVSLPDLISEGNIGLIRALKTFDSTRGLKFITYAKWWVRQSIVYAIIYKGHLVRIPQSQLRKLRKLREQKKAPVQRPAVRQSQPETDLFGEEAHELLTGCLVQPQFLEQPYGEDKSKRLLDFVADEDSKAPDHFVENVSWQADLKAAFDLLERREADILTMLFGLDGRASATLREVAVRYDISAERVRQIKNIAIDKLRASAEVREMLLDYMT